MSRELRTTAMADVVGEPEVSKQARDEAAPAVLSGPGIATRLHRWTWWTARFAAALFLFVGALQVMKMGAAGLDILHNGGLLVKNAGSTLGLGWLGALLVLSGSPVAASALALVASDSISETQGFTMLVGSRLGAAFVVLLVAVVYALRGGDGKRGAPLSTAVMALSTTSFIYIPGALLGFALLSWQPIQAIDLTPPGEFGGVIDAVYGGLLSRIEDLPAVLLFVGGVVLLLLAFKLIDTVVPDVSEEDLEDSSRRRWLHKKWAMFGLGCAVALVTMSVSVALTILVPLVAKRYLDRWEILPYIIGANITTLGDTLLAALLLDSPGAVRIVLTAILGTTVVSVILLAFFYDRMRLIIWRLQRRIMHSPKRLGLFTAALFLVPLTIVAVSAVAG